MPLTVTGHNRGPDILGNKTVFGMLPDDTDLCALFTRLHREGHIAATLRDGEVVTIALPEAEPPFETGQQALALIPSETIDRPFEVECQILVPIDAMVLCHAPNKGEVEQMIQDVFIGLRSQPRGFTVKVDREDTLAIFQRAKDGLSKGLASGIGAWRVQINRIEER